MKRLFIIFIACCVLGGTQGVTKEAPLSLEQPTLLRADVITTDHELGIITARGNVEIYHDLRSLKADMVSYNQQTDVVTASGNIILTEPDGEVIFSNYAELTGDLKEGLTREIRVILADNARFAASQGKRWGGTQTQLDRAVYSPCKICKQHPEKPLLWQIKSQTALLDSETHDVVYTDTVMEMFGVPVFYTPYFRHPDPTVKRRSGLLAPILGSSPSLGMFLGVPYYYVIAGDKDLTFTPLLTVKGGEFIGGEYRQRLSNGDFKFDGSVGQGKRLVNTQTNRKRESTRWHIDESFRLNLTKDWRGGLDIARSSDQTYLREFPFYGYTSENLLQSKAFAEGFYNRSYTAISTMAFQGLRLGDTQRTTPLVLPMMDLNYLSPPQAFGSHWSFDSNFLSLTRSKGADTQRFSNTGGWQVPYTSPFGDVYTLGLTLRADIYHTDHFTPLNTQKPITETRGRVFPEATLDWRYPFLQASMNHQVILEPVATLIGSPNLGKQQRIPNEDSVILEPTDFSLLQPSRFPGLDLIDDGSRLDYGVKTSSSFKKLAQGSLFLGQTYNFQKSSSVLQGTGFYRRTSDYVGRLEATCGSYLDLRYRFRLDRQNLAMRRNELGLGVGQPILRLTIDYIKLPRFIGETDSIGAQQIVFSLSSQFTSHWEGTVSTTRELGRQRGSLAHSVGVKYSDECFQFETLVTKSFYRDRDLKPGTGFLFRLMFKTLGEFRHSSTFGGTSRHPTLPRDSLLAR